VMNVAFHRGLITAPITKIPKPDLEEEVGRELLDHEIRALMQAAPDAEIQFMLETALRIGWRLEEMRACRWKWVDFDRSLINLPARSTKTKRARSVPIPRDVLTRLRLKHFDSPQALYIFPSVLDPRKPRYLRKSWDKMRLEARVTCRWHDTRHTCATRMLRAGISEARICKVLGMSPKVLRRIYEHLNVDDLRSAVDAVQLPVYLRKAPYLTGTRQAEVPCEVNFNYAYEYHTSLN
jgi:integrase